MTVHVAMLETVGRANVALQSVAIDTSVAGLFALTHIIQRFVNAESRVIEAVYTFPTPTDAVFLGLDVTIGDRVMRGVVMPDAKADRGYEQAIQDGDAAVLLRQIEPGLYSVSIGNVLPSEAISLDYTYAEQLSWQGDSLRLHMPTTIAPKYGSPAEIGLQPHELIEHSFEAGYALSVSLTVSGMLSKCTVSSPTHAIVTRSQADLVSIALARETTAMDRDLVIVLKSESDVPTMGVLAPDGEEMVAHIGFHLPQPKNMSPRAGVFKLVIDCSGSMVGDSIAQARAAAAEIIDQLDAEDVFNITAFGSHSRLLFKTPQPMNDASRAAAHAFVKGLAADMGGTEIGGALEVSHSASAKQQFAANVLLITDGQIYDNGAVIDANKRRGDRIFTLGVGSAVSASFLQTLALATGGACELVAPNEHLAAHIVRHFGRMRQAKVVGGKVHWGDAQVNWSYPEALEGFFAGDTLHVAAGLIGQALESVALEVIYEAGDSEYVPARLVRLNPNDLATAALPRVMASRRLAARSDAARIEMALKYQLLTEGTKCLMTLVRLDGSKAADFPELRTIPHQTGANLARLRLNAESYESALPPNVSRSASSEYPDTPAFLRRAPDAENTRSASVDSDMPFVDWDAPLLSRRERPKRKITQKLDTNAQLTTLKLSSALLNKLAGNNITTVAQLVSLPLDDWETALRLSDEDIAELLKALRHAGLRLTRR